jgi:hypothetical protein
MRTPEEQTPVDSDLSRRLYRALTAETGEILPLLDDSAMEVLRALLKNPRLAEPHLLTLLKRRDLPEDLLKAVAHLPQIAESHPLKVALVQHPATANHLVLSLLPQLYLFELVTICSLPGVSADRLVAAERAIIQRLPVTPLGSKITLARRAGTAVLETLLQEGHPQLTAACLDNPRLKESALFRFLNGPGAGPETISQVARHPRWQSRHELQRAILNNPKTPLIWFTALLPRFSLHEVRNLTVSGRLTGAQKERVREELQRRGVH